MSVTLECELDPIFPNVCFCFCFSEISGRVMFIDDIIVNVVL